MHSINNKTTRTWVSEALSPLIKILVLITCSLSLLYSATTMATPHRHSSASLLISQAPLISREEAIAIAKQGKNSKVLKVNKQTNSSGSTYKVKLLTKEGRVKQVIVNASTGQIEQK